MDIVRDDFQNYDEYLYFQDLQQGRMQRARSGSRTRSRSSGKRRSVARSRSVPATSLVSRSLKYTGYCKMARSCTMQMTIQKSAGFLLGGTNWAEGMLTFSPQGLTFRGDSTHSTTTPLPQYAELAAVWERVRIDKVELTILSNAQDQTIADTEPSGNSLRLIIANDRNGEAVGAVSTTSYVNQCTDAQYYSAGGDHKPIKWTIIKPNYRRLVQYDPSGLPSYEPTNGFIDSSFDVQHHGVRIGIPSIGTVSPCRVQIFAKFFFSLSGIQ